MSARITLAAARDRVTVTLDEQSSNFTPAAAEDLADSLQVARVIRVGSATLGLDREDARAVAKGLREKATAARSATAGEVSDG